MFDLPTDLVDATLGFWLGVTGSSLSPWRGDDDEYATLVPPDGDDYLRVQRLVGAPRVHLDLHVGSDEPAPDDAARTALVRAELVRALALGAALEHDAGTHAVLSSPGGYVFCLVRDGGQRTRPAPVTVADVEVRSSDDRAAALVDQVCLDVPEPLFEQELAFWTGLTGWGAGRSRRDELVALERPIGMPLRIMLQRLGADDPRREVTAHLDLACTARPAVERAHLAVGARLVGRGPRWTTLADPSGLPYCLTDRDPTTGHLPTP